MIEPRSVKQHSTIIQKVTPSESKAFQRSYYAKKAIKVHKLDAQVKGGKLVIRMGL